MDGVVNCAIGSSSTNTRTAVHHNWPKTRWQGQQLWITISQKSSVGGYRSSRSSVLKELAGEGALPSQLLTPARRLLEISELRNRLRQPIRKGSSVRRDYSDPQTLSYSYSALRLSDQLSDYEIDCIDEKDRNLSRVLFKSSRLRSRSVKYLSAVLVNLSSAAIIVPGADPWRARAQSLLVLDRWHRNNSRSIFVEISSRVLVNPMSSVFDRSVTPQPYTS
nr:hypothetical protein Iba_chr03aCG0920 [Ipomoea batatas]